MSDAATSETAADAVGPASYWAQTRRPVVCLAFLAPLLVVYEAGALWLAGFGGGGPRNGADLWLRGVLGTAGPHAALALPFLVAGLLLAWNFYGHHPWRVRASTLQGMFGESLLWAFALVAAAAGADWAVHGTVPGLGWEVFGGGHADGPPTASIPVRETAARAVTFVGAGIYEELLFRLTLLPVAYGLFRLLRANRTGASILAVAATSLLFALAHHLGPGGEPVTAFASLFRVAAGAAFALLFVTRGFGVTVGTHSGYDLIVGVLLAQG